MSLRAIFFLFFLFFFWRCRDHRDLHVAVHSFPTRRSSDLLRERAVPRAAIWTAWALALALFAGAAAIRVMDWSAVVALVPSEETYAPASRYREPGFVLAAQGFA